MTPLDVLTHERHFADHLVPIWHQLPAEAQGTWWAPDGLLGHLQSLGVEARAYDSRKQLECLWTEVELSSPVLVASFGDLQIASKARRPVILSEHGAGQSYGSDHTSYAGGSGRASVILLLVPGPAPAARNRAAYPLIPCREVGCPKLDEFCAAGPRPRSSPPVVAVSWHWDCPVCPETRSAWPSYQLELPDLVAAAAAGELQLLGHGHPRMLAQLEPVYRELGVEVVRNFDEVLARADLYCCDNSSTLFEFAATGRPVVLMDCPLYRQDVHHGLRFWSEADVGLRCPPGQLLATVREALLDPEEVRLARRRAVARVYSACDGMAAYRAAQAILEVIEPMQHQDPKAPVGGVRMEALKDYVDCEGDVSRGDIVYAGYRRKGKEWQRLAGVHPEVRARKLEGAGFAVRRPLPPGLRPQPPEDKMVRPPQPPAPPQRSHSVAVKCRECGELFGRMAALKKHREQVHKS